MFKVLRIENVGYFSRELNISSLLFTTIIRRAIPRVSNHLALSMRKGTRSYRYGERSTK